MDTSQVSEDDVRRIAQGLLDDQLQQWLISVRLTFPQIFAQWNFYGGGTSMEITFIDPTLDQAGCWVVFGYGNTAWNGGYELSYNDGTDHLIGRDDTGNERQAFLGVAILKNGWKFKLSTWGDGGAFGVTRLCPATGFKLRKHGQSTNLANSFTARVFQYDVGSTSEGSTPIIDVIYQNNLLYSYDTPKVPG